MLLPGGHKSCIQEILFKTGKEHCDLDVKEDDMVDEDTDEIDLDYEITDVTRPSAFTLAKHCVELVG